MTKRDGGGYVDAGGDFDRDTRYITTRVTADGGTASRSSPAGTGSW